MLIYSILEITTKLDYTFTKNKNWLQQHLYAMPCGTLRIAKPLATMSEKPSEFRNLTQQIEKLDLLYGHKKIP